MIEENMNEKIYNEKEEMLRDILFQLEKEDISQQLIEKIQIICSEKEISTENKEQIAKMLFQKGYKTEGISILRNILDDTNTPFFEKDGVPEILSKLGCADESLSAWLKLIDFIPENFFLEKTIVRKQIFQNRWEKKIVATLADSNVGVDERKDIIDKLVSIKSFRAISLFLEESEIEIPLFIYALNALLHPLEEPIGFIYEPNYDAIIQNEMIKIIQSDLFSIAKRKAAINALHNFTNGDVDLKQLIQDKGLVPELQTFSNSVLNNKL